MADECWVPIPAGSPYPLANLPIGVGHSGDGRWRAWVALGDVALDLAASHDAGAFSGIELPDGCSGGSHAGAPDE